VNDKTIVRRFRDTVDASSITTEDAAFVLGEPDASGEVQAKFIRLVPAMR
jgi:hypothetical protein